MFTRFNRQISVFLAALLGVFVGSVGPGVARAAYDAVNADKVDGKHAVSSSATGTQRRGKLVATNPTTGRLPNNIIAKAPDSSELNGYPHSSLRSLSPSVHGAFVEGSFTKHKYGVLMPATGTGTLNLSFVIPADHKAGTPLMMDVMLDEPSAGACSLYIDSLGTGGPNGDFTFNSGWRYPGRTSFEGPVSIPAGQRTVYTRTFTWTAGSQPGDLLTFSFSRFGDFLADTCGLTVLRALQLRY